MAARLAAVHRWCVSGTPVGKGRVEDLYGLLLFLRAAPFDDPAVWKHALQEPAEARHPHSIDRLMQVRCGVILCYTALYC
jgi:E3 ubiquitin-protein ligase SHPRH